MIKAVLLDLDDTLLRLNTDTFVEHYLTGLVTLLIERYPELAKADPPVAKSIVRGVRAVLTSTDPTLSNAQVFSKVLSNAINLPAEAIQAVYQDYHDNGYRKLASETEIVPGAVELIKRLSDMGLAVVIATNPIFSLDAVMQRLVWGGLHEVPYAFITHVDNMHFAKPNPHYYEEILARIGVEADEAIMLGDSMANDTSPAGAAGLNTYHILTPYSGEAKNAANTPNVIKPDGEGSLTDFDRLVADGWLSTLKPRPRTATQVIPRMLGNVGALYGMIDGIKPEYWNMRPDPNEWSPLETLYHLCESERTVQRPRLERIAAENNPFVAQPPTPPGPGARDLSEIDGLSLLSAFWDERCRTVEFLQSLGDDDWQRPARHSIFGPTTLLEMALFTTRHDHLHLTQLCQTIGKCR